MEGENVQHRQAGSEVHSGAAQQSGRGAHRTVTHSVTTNTCYTATTGAGHTAVTGPGTVWASPPHEPTALKSEGIRAGEIIAWRVWYVEDDKLLGLWVHNRWIPGEPVRGDPAAGYGVHAFKKKERAEYEACRADRVPWAVGQVALWGDIIEHEGGYRAEFGSVHSLVAFSKDVPEEARRLLREKYKVPAFKLDDAA